MRIPNRSLRRTALAAVVFAACADRGARRVAVVMSSSGSTGARLAAEDIAAASRGGRAPLTIGIAISEGATPAGPSIAIADSIAADAGTIAVVGHSNSATSLAASQIYNARGLPQIAPTTTAPLYGSAGPYSFRLVPDDSRQAAFLAGIAAKAGGRVFVVYVNDDYGRGLRTAVHNELAARHVTVSGELPYLEQPDTLSVQPVITALLADRPEQLLWLGRSQELAVVLAAVRPRLPRLAVLGSDGVETERLYTSPGPFAGVRFARFIDPESSSEGIARLRARLHDQLHLPLTAEMVLSYDAVMLVDAAVRSGARDRGAVRRYLVSLGRQRAPYVGLSGPIAFDSTGSVLRPHLLAEVTATGVRGVDP